MVNNIQFVFRKCLALPTSQILYFLFLVVAAAILPTQNRYAWMLPDLSGKRDLLGDGRLHFNLSHRWEHILGPMGLDD